MDKVLRQSRDGPIIFKPAESTNSINVSKDYELPALRNAKTKYYLSNLRDSFLPTCSCKTQ
jgi:hypothetical protein